MSYSVNLHGNSDFDTAEEVEAFEKEVIERVTNFANSLRGMSGGTVNTTTQPQAVLQPSDGGAAVHEDGRLIEPPADEPADEPEPTTGNPTVPADGAPVTPPASGEPPAPSGVSSPASLSDLSVEDLQAEIARRAAG